MFFLSFLFRCHSQQTNNSLCEDHICEAEIAQKGNKVSGLLLHFFAFFSVSCLIQLIRVDAVIWNQQKTNKVALGRVLFKVIKQSTHIGEAMEASIKKLENSSQPPQSEPQSQEASK